MLTRRSVLAGIAATTVSGRLVKEPAVQRLLTPPFKLMYPDLFKQDFTMIERRAVAMLLMLEDIGDYADATGLMTVGYGASPATD